MTIISLLAGLFFSQITFGQMGEMPPLSDDQVEEKLEFLLYNSMHSFEEISSEVKDIYKSKIRNTKAKLHYNEFLHGINGSLDLEIYQAEDLKDKKVPVVIIFPPIGGISLVDHGYAQYFARKGYIAVISQLTEDILSLTSVPQVMNSFKNTMTRNRILVDYLSEHPNVDKDRIGVFGVSLGGIRSALFYGIEDRVSGAVSIVGGGNVPGIMAYSEQKTVVKLRDRLMKKHDITNDQDFEVYLRENYLIDPTDFSSLINPEDFYIVMAKKDTSVPTVYQKELQKRFHYPKTKKVKLDHKWTIIVMYLFKYSVGKFFDSNFMIANAVDLDEEIEVKRNREDVDRVIQEIEEKY